ncbi:RNA-directed DNA polymerase, eukaryota [Tanacetum coccineum]
MVKGRAGKCTREGGIGYKPWGCLSDVEGLLSRLQKLKIGGELLRVFVAYDRNRSGNASWRDVGYGDSRHFNSNSNMGRNEAVGVNPRVNRSYVDVVNGGYKRRDVGDKRSNDGSKDKRVNEDSGYKEKGNEGLEKQWKGRTFEVEGNEINDEIMGRSIIGERYGKGENDMQIDEEEDGEEDGIPVSVEGDDSDEEEEGGNNGEYGGCGGPVKVFGGWIVEEDGCGNYLDSVVSLNHQKLNQQPFVFKVPKGVLKTMESIRSKFFNGVDSSDRKISWVAWDNVLASKLNGGLGVSSFFALNRALLLKWVWRFISGDGSLWCKVIQAIYGSKFDLHVTDQPSIWCSILREVKSLKDSGFDFSSHCKKRIGDGSCTSFWYDIWLADAPLCVQFPRLFALELDKEIVVANKMGASSVSASFRRDVRDGAERQQWDDLSSIMNSVVLSSSKDRWTCDLSGDGEFKVKVIRNFIDDLFLPSSDVATRWVKFIPIKVNVFSWRARRDRLPTRVNLSRRGVLLDSHLCPLCNAAMEDVQHVFFRCDVARVVLRKICRWWDLDWQEICSFSDWDAWFLSFRLSSRLKSILEVGLNENFASSLTYSTSLSGSNEFTLVDLSTLYLLLDSFLIPEFSTN